MVDHALRRDAFAEAFPVSAQRTGETRGKTSSRSRIPDYPQRSHRSFTAPPKLLRPAVGHRTRPPGQLREGAHIIARAQKYVNPWTDSQRDDEALR